MNRHEPRSPGSARTRTANVKAERPTIIGVISDTHGLLRHEAVEALRGSDRILHAGDIGAPEILKALAKIAPVTAIRGNVDTEPWARRLPKAEIVEAGGISIYMLHDLSELDLKPEAAGFHVVIYGHSHRPKIEQKNGVWYFNPGSAGSRRFDLPVSIGRLTIAPGGPQAELVEVQLLTEKSSTQEKGRL
jgi:putative phosphoesterase